jgi:hypothetical protein
VNRRLILRKFPAFEVAVLAMVATIALTLVGSGSGGSSSVLRNPSKKATPVMTDAQKMTPEDLLFEEQKWFDRYLFGVKK